MMLHHLKAVIVIFYLLIKFTSSVAFTNSVLSSTSSPSSSLRTMNASPTTKNNINALPDRVDYLVIGAGATGMAFCDTLLHQSPTSVSVVLIDAKTRPGGHWNDSYNFVRLHQPSDMYGVESMKLEPSDDVASIDNDKNDESHHRATRLEILEYYTKVCNMLEENYNFHFVGGTTFDMSQLDLLDGDNTQSRLPSASDDIEYKLPEGRSIMARKVVDARYLEPDLPVHIPPKFQYDQTIRMIPVNSLASDTDEQQTKHYVIIGAGKTGMDAIVYLLQHQSVDPSDIMWIVPNEAWITSRENLGSCMEFLHECTELLEKSEDRNETLKSSDFFQRGFLEWEKQGKIYRFDKNILPTKFKDATLSLSELALIKNVKRVVRNGRVASIDDMGTIEFIDGSSLPLPWKDQKAATDTTFVHCSAGAFNYSKQTKKPPPVFTPHRIHIQDVYGTPGFCFIGSIIGKLESLGAKLSDAEKNAMCSVETSSVPDGTDRTADGGNIGVISDNHGYVKRLSNLKKWLQVPEIRDWLVGHRLFNLRDYTADDIETLVKDTHETLEKYEIVSADV